jgi:hypothetical protein
VGAVGSLPQAAAIMSRSATAKAAAGPEVRGRVGVITATG